MIKCILVFLFVTLNINLFSQDMSKQQLDRLYSDFVRSRTVSGNISTSIGSQHIKCNTTLVNSVRMHIKSFTPAQQRVLNTLITRPVLQASLVSPSGYFRIHYDTTGINKPNYGNDTLFYTHLKEVAVAADSAFSFEINYLGYPVPPSDDTAGGDNKYDIYLEDLGGGVYGDTQFEFVTGDKGPSYMEVNNEFNYSEFPTNGLDAVRVTVAHEFHHAIQGGDYIYRSEDAWFHELTSTSMESFVFNTIHDYYNYLPNYFSYPSRSIAENDVNSGDGYDVAIWNIYLQNKFGFDIIKMQWELMPQYRAVVCINKSIDKKNAYFNQVLNEFGVWVYYTDYRKKSAPPGKSFQDGENYPLINIPLSQTFQIPPYSTVNGTNSPFSNNYLKMIIRPANDIDSLVTIISNSDYNTALVNTNSTLSYQFQISDNNFSGSRNIAGKYFSLLSAAYSQFWVDSEILNNVLADSGMFISGNADYVFPSPFRYNNPNYIYLYIPVDPNSAGEIDLNIYSMSMKLVFSSAELIEKPFGHPVVKWNPRNNNNEKLSSGIYIYAVKSGDKVKTGKIVVFNE